jgi:manganese/iron transport system permease protein/iron/zinc/copper transport system permease protein
MIALICVAGISMVGVIMIVGLLITPAALAYMFTDRLPRMMLLAAFFGVLSVVLGLYFSEWVNASGGGAIMFTGFLLFLAGLLSAPRYGVLANWWRRRTLVPQSDIEDLLKAALEDLDVRRLPIPSGRIRRGVHRLIRDGLVMAMTPDGHLHLAEAGQREAAHIERSHQLWEGHLMSRGMEADAAHAAAERLEHLHDRRVLDEFDNELDHPGVDAHGIPIPGEQEACSEEVAPLRLSLMRQGDRGRVQGGKMVAGLLPGTAFRLQGRDLLSGDWIVHPDDGECLRVPHDDADEVAVDICD